jgi:hypothetical protein
MNSKAKRLLRKHNKKLSSLQEAFVSSFHATFLACAAIAALGIATSLVRGKERG